MTGAITGLLFGLLLPWLLGHDYPVWPWVIAAALGSLALLLPAVLAPVRRTWMAVGHGLGWLNTRLILGLMFYVIILPIGLALRLMGWDPMARKLARSLDSYRTPSPPPDPNHMERPF